MRVEKEYKGVIVPMVTPIDEQYMIDKVAVEKILATFLQSGVAPFLLGTTGESVSFSIAQKNDLVKSVVELVNGSEKVYAGISGNSLLESIDEAVRYADMGVDAVVAHLPFYYPIDEDQMLKYYEELANKVPCPLFLYNNPITTNISIPLEVIEKLSYHENIVGVKDSERGIERLDESIRLWGDRKDFAHLLGWAAQSAYAVIKGSDGIVPSTGNISPALYKELYEAAIDGVNDQAERIQEKTNKISEVYQKGRKLNQSIPALKLIMSFYDLCKPEVMPPMYKLDEKETEIVKKAMVEEMGALL